MDIIIAASLKGYYGDFSGGSVVRKIKLHAPNAGGRGSNPNGETKIPHALQHSPINNKRLFENQMGAGHQRVL